MLKSVFCVDLIGFVCVAFEHNYVKAKKDRPCEHCQRQRPGTTFWRYKTYAHIRGDSLYSLNSDKRVCVYSAYGYAACHRDTTV